MDFNIVCFPQDNRLIEQCINWAQVNLSTQAKEYLLGANARPHITLCRYESEPQMSANVWQSIMPLYNNPIKIQFDYIYISPARNEHVGKFWIGLAVRPTPELCQLQLLVYETLSKMRIAVKTVPSRYFPHLTWALCKGPLPPGFKVLPPEDFWSNTHSFVLSLGESDQNGVYHKTLFSV